MALVLRNFRGLEPAFDRNPKADVASFCEIIVEIRGCQLVLPSVGLRIVELLGGSEPSGLGCFLSPCRLALVRWLEVR